MPNRLGTIDEIYNAMVTLEQAKFLPLFPLFQAYAYAPAANTREFTRFPLSFRFPASVLTEDRGMGRGQVDKPFQLVIDVMFLCGPSTNDFGSLTKKASDIIIPFYELYYANRSILDEVAGLDFGEAIMGDVKVNGHFFYGCQFPIIARQRRHFISSL